MSFALSKLSWLARGRNGGTSRGGRSALRRADSHPDAPVRTPIFASRDFGGLDIFPRTTPQRPDVAAPEAAPVVLALPRMAPAVEEEPTASPQPALPAVERDEVPADEGEFAPIEASFTESVQHQEPLHAQTLSELTARLERGLARRERVARSGPAVLADMPVEPAIPVREKVEDDVDEALRAALGTLRAMAARTR